jgi:HD-GYP domain-containing protein (c-di-GMP phosphodiesterase class II)
MSLVAEVRTTPPVVRWYASMLALLAVFVMGVPVVARAPLGNTWFVMALGAVAAVAERGSVRLTQTTEESISILPMLFAAVLFGPVAAAFVGAASMIGDFRSPYLRWVVYTSTRTINGALTGVAVMAVQAASMSHIGEIAVATAVGAITAQTVDLVFAALTHRLRGNGTFIDLVATVTPLAYAALPLYIPVVALLAFAYLDVSPWTAPLFFAPALAAQRLFAMYQDQRRLTGDLRTANNRLERANLSFATALVVTVDARDRYTAGHSAAVAVYSRDIASRMGLSEDFQRLAHVCGLVHDVGKIGLAPGLLEKPGALTLEERRQMETHSAIGERILSKVDDYREIAAIVRHHHERVDGNGYPDGLAGDDIPLLSRVIAVADAYNAMTSDRPYREAMPSRVARLRLAQAVETQFDTSVVAAFEAILAGSSELYRLGIANEFTLEANESRSRAAATPSARSLALAQ